MAILSSGDFWTIVAVAVATLGVHFAAKADRRRERRDADQRREAGEKRLAERISAQRRELAEAISAQSRRINRLEDRLLEVAAALGELKAEVGALSTKVDERSFPRHFEGGGLPGAETTVGVREAPARYSGDEPKE